MKEIERFFKSLEKEGLVEADVSHGGTRYVYCEGKLSHGLEDIVEIGRRKRLIFFRATGIASVLLVVLLILLLISGPGNEEKPVIPVLDKPDSVTLFFIEIQSFPGKLWKYICVWYERFIVPSAEKLKQYREYISVVEKSLEECKYSFAQKHLNKAKALNIGDAVEIAVLEKKIKECREKIREKIREKKSDSVPTIVFDYMEEAYRKECGEKLATFDLKVSEQGETAIGELALTLKIDSTGKISFKRITDENMAVFPRNRFKYIKGKILNAIKSVVLTPPKAVNGNAVKVDEWYLAYKIITFEGNIRLEVVSKNKKEETHGK